MKPAYSRRDVLKSLLAVPLILTPGGLVRAQQRRESPPLLDMRRQKPFQNRLPRPSLAAPQPGTRHYEIAARQFRRWLGLIEPRTGTPEDLEKIYQADVVTWRQIITESNIQPN